MAWGLEQIDSRELTEWLLYFEILNEEHELRQLGLSDDEIADAIEQRRTMTSESGLIDRLLSEQDVEQRRHALLERELEDDEDEQDE